MKYIILFTLFFLPSVAFANEVRLDSSKTEVRVGEEFTVSVLSHTSESINAIEGEVVFADDLFSLKEIYEGNSVVNFWIEKPESSAEGKIAFSGITPGGFSGANQLIFSFILVAKKEGINTINFNNLNLLKNDGYGTKLDNTTHSIQIAIREGDDALRKEVIVDNVPPEDFKIYLTQDENIFENMYFIVFTTQDKISGISHYEIKEGKFSIYKEVQSPYLLKNQALNKDIYVKVVDKMGNERIVILDAKNKKSLWQEYIYFVILILALAIVSITRILWSKFSK